MKRRDELDAFKEWSDNEAYDQRTPFDAWCAAIGATAKAKANDLKRMER